MSKGKRKRRRPGSGQRTVSGTGTGAILDELAGRAAELEGAAPDASGPVWGAVHKLLLKAKADPGEVARVVATRDAEALERLVARLRGDEPEPEASAGPEAESAEAPAGRAVDPDTLKRAMRAFRKRLKLTRLDHESKLGVGPMTGGRKADFDGILAPNEFSSEVWEALVAEGKLRSLGQGFFMLADEGPGTSESLES